MCFRNFSADFIELHAQKCKGENIADSIENTSGKERPLSKKLKLSVGGAGQPIQSSKRKTSSQTAGHAVGLSSSYAAPEGKKSTTLQKSHIPLAEQSRPGDFNEYVGQEKVLGKGSMLLELLQHGQTPSMILWGPPGCGKTSLAHVIAMENKSKHGNSTRFVKLSATNSGKADIQVECGLISQFEDQEYILVTAII